MDLDNLLGRWSLCESFGLSLLTVTYRFARIPAFVLGFYN